ncbi:Sir2-type NAD-dependent protein deacetylase [Natrialba magadii ATCC 43099]|uniref:Silent information regulator protein Sir2 n=1 Tax=Natrialba magadii (strain ATCC 43099 / DSM 3394 / CCM 3739 / CIP 104546 / IAM 13178 / JCM 8861 / NBRC 102185 / NCIMB 2190 / MS3) TaxID=547559 RepID=D3SRF0_NATMM|nr:Sir2 family NAD-dependent protein deacetylase [Natrialba magadii]ADD04655.1 Sir2-type NAD-dependent protein deacetylase [Natrialba magadii ATCC 43099]ELY25311.1 silent information regulator protein Sir2 [Natrialba magadii ATCC 43099]
MTDLEHLASSIDDAETAVAFTGAGISAPSGVPTFRGDDGVWDAFDEGQFTYGRFQRDPAGFWADRVDLYRTMFDEEYEPNAAHGVLAEFARDDVLESVLTQNTDGLHAKAATRASSGGETGEAERETDADEFATHESILELHGNARRVRCTDCGTRVGSDPIVERAEDGELPPRCECGGIYKPDVVLFGEQLPKTVLQRARSLARESDVFLAIGSSLVVEPAASLPRIAASNGATVGIVNLESTPVDSVADVCLRDDVTTVLPRLQELVDSSVST